MFCLGIVSSVVSLVVLVLFFVLAARFVKAFELIAQSSERVANRYGEANLAAPAAPATGQQQADQPQPI
jgi:hypothetical protein